MEEKLLKFAKLHSFYHLLGSYHMYDGPSGVEDFFKTNRTGNITVKNKIKDVDRVTQGMREAERVLKDVYDTSQLLFSDTSICREMFCEISIAHLPVTGDEWLSDHNNGYVNMVDSASQSQTLSKHKYVRRSGGTGVNLKLDTKKEFDEEREKRIQLYAERWENGCECLSGKPMQGGSWEEWYQWRLRYDLKTKKDQKFLSEGK